MRDVSEVAFAANDLEWAPIPRSQLDIERCLTSGQTFLWKRSASGRFIVATHDTLMLLDPRADGFFWATSPPDRWDHVATFFALDVDLAALYRDWIRRDARFAHYIRSAEGLRVLRQDPGAALIAFICSACNNVPRIQMLLRRLAVAVGHVPEVPWSEVMPLHPLPGDLRVLREADLRALGFGYRARYLSSLPVAGPADVGALASLPYAEARAQLMRIAGVGPKVADCVCLYGLGMAQVVPVDTHIRQYAVKHLAPDLAGRSLTPRHYDALGSLFRGIMGPYAGWAQQYVYVYQRQVARSRPVVIR